MSDKILASFKEFLTDPDGYEFYLSGQAGTGKTTYLKTLMDYCADNGRSALACAYTHKACSVLRSKLSPESNVATLHSFLKKRPSTNDHATKVEHLHVSSKQGESEHVDVLFVDEYSNAGEKDYVDIGFIQDPEYEGKPRTKVVYLGDPNQLPPVNDQQAIYPCGTYNHTLTKVWRQEGNADLLDILCNLVSYIEGADPEPLASNGHFIRGADLMVTLAQHEGENNAVLAYTNQRVEQLNSCIEGKDVPDRNDEMFSPTTRKFYTFLDIQQPEDVAYIFRAWNDPLGLGSKYKSLEHLISMNKCEFMEVIGEDLDDVEVWAVVFGHYQYKMVMQELADAAVASNKAIEDEFNCRAKDWAYANKRHKLARARSKAWRDYITFKENVICMDFTHAMTIHKSQGSTFDNVFIDMQDLGICASKDYTIYLKLLYVAISRARNYVYTN